jgi:hypothetical protein
MDDISNKTLAILLVFAMAISLGGTVISLNRLRISGTQAPGITGFGTGTGTANLSITSDTTITVIQNLVDFGTGIINMTAGCTNATLASSSVNATNWTAEYDACWVSNATTPAMVLFPSSAIVVRNDGNINVTLTMDSTANTAATFIAGATGGGPLYQYKSASNETDACDNPQNASWYNLNASTSMAICDKLKAENSQDEARISFKVRIPSDATGYKSDTLTFTSS